MRALFYHQVASMPVLEGRLPHLRFLSQWTAESGRSPRAGMGSHRRARPRGGQGLDRQDMFAGWTGGCCPGA